jgi:hypothetical protein
MDLPEDVVRVEALDGQHLNKEEIEKFRKEWLMALHSCPHPDEHVECIAQMEYPGGSISWCKRCGAWKDDELGEWHLPEGS